MAGARRDGLKPGVATAHAGRSLRAGRRTAGMTIPTALPIGSASASSTGRTGFFRPVCRVRPMVHLLPSIEGGSRRTADPEDPAIDLSSWKVECACSRSTVRCWPAGEPSPGSWRPPARAGAEASSSGLRSQAPTRRTPPLPYGTRGIRARARWNARPRNRSSTTTRRRSSVRHVARASPPARRRARTAG